MTARDMTAASLTWFDDDDPRDLRRWAIAALVVLGIHLAAIAAYVYIHKPDEIGDEAAPIAVDFAPTNDTIDQPEIAPVPEQPPQQIEKPPPPPPPEPQAVVAPVEPPPPKVEEQKPPTPAVQARVKGGAPQVAPSYVTAIVKHLEHYRPPYPNEAEEGTVFVKFQIDRSGHVLERHILRSSGHTDLDSAALAMIDRAQPFPPFPATMSQPDEYFDFPLHFTNH
jgi:periplasmic protein TonB